MLPTPHPKGSVITFPPLNISHTRLRSLTIKAQDGTLIVSTNKMKEVIVSKGPKCKIVDSPIPLPGDNQVTIKVVVSGSNPKDWKRAEAGGELNTGDDIAGVVHTVGSNVVEFKPGDRVVS